MKKKKPRHTTLYWYVRIYIVLQDDIGKDFLNDWTILGSKLRRSLPTQTLGVLDDWTGEFDYSMNKK